MDRPSVLAAAAKGAKVGLAAGVLGCAPGLWYVLGSPSAFGAAGWGRVGAVFVAQLAVTGAVLGAAIRGATALARRPILASMVATVAVAAPSGAFGATYFGSLEAPFMGSAVLFAIPSILVVVLAASLAWLDTPSRPARAALAASVLALPILLAGAIAAASIPEADALAALRSMPLPAVGGLCGAIVGAAFGLYAGLVVGAVRLGERGGAPARVRVDVPFADPLADEEAELEARFAELERSEPTQPASGSLRQSPWSVQDA